MPSLIERIIREVDAIRKNKRIVSVLKILGGMDLESFAGNKRKREEQESTDDEEEE